MDSTTDAASAAFNLSTYHSPEPRVSLSNDDGGSPLQRAQINVSTVNLFRNHLYFKNQTISQQFTERIRSKTKVERRKASWHEHYLIVLLLWAHHDVYTRRRTIALIVSGIATDSCRCCGARFPRMVPLGRNEAESRHMRSRASYLASHRSRTMPATRSVFEPIALRVDRHFVSRLMLLLDEHLDALALRTQILLVTLDA